ncbi:MFS transporter MCP family solute carrier family 16 member 10 [Penicillium concentricum]|uniref:MFS transporter MCP family solute carrier family 16 member 10 n=1 Tax=Penicillium concentricum TaxID=293559 RepID=A0A9W9R906_9EURO|nr:MFS transporter MCP family solute carrier family 16 member 10 [Penicillium concentricum]KAJ5355852.1 MFS transporter MCP family solute carrier family 16 member 10 [Penicillium concentricum]
MEVSRHNGKKTGYGTIDPQSPSDTFPPRSPESQIGAAYSEDVSKYESYPDGGIKSWLVVFGCFCAFFSALSFMNSIGVYHSWIASHQLQAEGAGKIGWIFGFSNFLTFVASLFIGPVFDSCGPRPLSAVGPVFLQAQYILLGFCRTYWHFFFCIGVFGGIGTCVLFTCAIGTIQHWFFHRRGLAMGLAISGGSASGILLPLIISGILPKIGFQKTTLTVSVILLPFEIAAVVLMTTPTLSAKHRQRLSLDGRWKAMPSLRILLELQPFLIALGLLFGELAMFIPMTCYFVRPEP